MGLGCEILRPKNLKSVAMPTVVMRYMGLGCGTPTNLKILIT